MYLCVCVCLYECIYVCMFTYSSRRDPPICRILDLLMSWNQEKILERSKVGRSVLGSSLVEDVFCTVETKDDRRI
jgi:hypothetical protein